MIFATCGSSPVPFDRMMQALAELPAGELHVQHGPAAPPPCAGAYDFLPFHRMVELIERADVVVSHAGVGSIICALRAGHTPIVFPRLKRHSETVDDHQAELAEALVDRGNVVVAWTPEDLVAAVAAATPRGIARVLAADALGDAVRAALLGERHPTFVRNDRVPRRIRRVTHRLPDMIRRFDRSPGKIVTDGPDDAPPSAGAGVVPVPAGAPKVMERA